MISSAVAVFPSNLFVFVSLSWFSCAERAEESTADVQENIPEDAKQTWRIAAPCENANALFLRQATKSKFINGFSLLLLM